MGGNVSIRVGYVSSINYPAGKVRVTFKDQDDIVTDELPTLDFEYEMPEIGEPVICLFLGNGISKGVCLKRFFSLVNMPVESGPGLYYKDWFGDGFMRYDRFTHTLTLHAEHVVIEGDLSVTGSISAAGNIGSQGSINAGGTITDAGGNTNHHSHG